MMSPTIPAMRPSRPAAAVNAEIRALMEHAAGRLRVEDRPVYAALLEEWAAAVRAEETAAAA